MDEMIDGILVTKHIAGGVLQLKKTVHAGIPG